MLVMVITVVVAVVVASRFLEPSLESLPHEFGFADLYQKIFNHRFPACERATKTYFINIESLFVNATFFQAVLATDVDSIGNLRV